MLENLPKTVRIFGETSLISESPGVGRKNTLKISLDLNLTTPEFHQNFRMVAQIGIKGSFLTIEAQL